jgi:predicted RNase H-like HicB family nuclease
MRFVYPACFYKEPDGRFSVVVPDFPLATYGDDMTDAIFMAQDAIAGRLLCLLDDHESPPTPTPLSGITPEDPTGFVTYIYGTLPHQTYYSLAPQLVTA